MTFRTHKEIGSSLTEWGFEDGGNYNEKIKNLPPEVRTNCLIAAVAWCLEDIEKSLLNLRISLDEGKLSSAVSDGAIYWLTHSNDKRVDQMDKSTLSVRARKVIEQANIRFRSEITKENLYGRRNCGAKTMQELLKWAKP